MSPYRTSDSHPLRIKWVILGESFGRIGIALCPGKKDPSAKTGSWYRDLDSDLDKVRRWGATAVISLIEDHEFNYLQVRGFAEGVRDRHMEWWHLPIPDGQPPGSDFKHAWGVAGDAIRDRLRMGFDVLIHRKGGLGRAGTVVACLLVELGESPDEAIRKVRAARNGGIENRLQERHVERYKPPKPTVQSTTSEPRRDRAVGAFLGLAVGDALGTTLEFRNRDSEPRLVDIVGGGPFNLRPGNWTDDTSMALALADSLIASGRLDCRDLMDRFVAWWLGGEYACTGRCFDIGNTIQQALQRYRRTGDPLAGSTDPWTAGNGSLMRLAPVALRYWRNRDRLSLVAAEQSRTTHAAREAVDACRAFADLLAEAISRKPRRDVLAPRPFEGARRSRGSSVAAGADGHGTRSGLAGTWFTRSRQPSGRSHALPTSGMPCCSQPT